MSKLTNFRIRSPKIRIRKRLKFGDRITVVGRIISLEKPSKEKPPNIAHAVVPHEVYVGQLKDGKCPLCGETHSP